MSFILDALRKSESERQRGAVPRISHVPFAAPRHRLPAWALTLMVLLGASVVGLGGAWWQSSSRPQAEASPRGTGHESTVSAPLEILAPRARGQDGAPPPPNTSASRRLANLTDPRESTASISAPEVPAAAEDPAPEPVAVAASSEASSAGTWHTLPTAATLAAEGIALPSLRLELHVFYRDRPADRLVIINGGRYREGDVITEGPQVIAIESTGAMLSYQGREFTLSPE